MVHSQSRQLTEGRLIRLAGLPLARRGTHLEAILGEVVRAAHDLLPATAGASVVLWDAATETFTDAATSVPEQRDVDPSARVRQQGGATRQIVDTRRRIVVPDTRQLGDEHGSMVDEFAIGAFVGTPVRHQGKILGVLYALERHPRQYTAADLAFLDLLAGRAGEAIAQARALEAAEESRRRAEITAHANLVMLEADGLEAIVLAALRAVVEALHADSARFLLSDDGSDIEITYPVASDGSDFSKAGPASLATRVGRPVSSQGWREEPHAAAAPIRVLDEPAVIEVARREGGMFQPHDLDLLAGVGSSLSLAIAKDSHLQRSRELATTDYLTKLANRRHFEDVGGRMVASARRYGRDAALVILDLDRFKSVNDAFGHQVGDAVIAEAGRRLLDTVRDADLVARYGGEEFVIVMPETDLAAAVEVAERIRSAFSRQAISTPAGPVRVTISAGVASLRGRDVDLEPLCNEADRALLAAKQAGRDRVQAAGSVVATA